MNQEPRRAHTFEVHDVSVGQRIDELYVVSDPRRSMFTTRQIVRHVSVGMKGNKLRSRSCGMRTLAIDAQPTAAGVVRPPEQTASRSARQTLANAECVWEGQLYDESRTRAFLIFRCSGRCRVERLQTVLAT